MQSNFTTNLLRNSYGFEKSTSMFLKSPNAKGFPMQSQNNKDK